MVSVSKHLVDPREVPQRYEAGEVSEFGSKTLMLANLLRSGFPVPPFLAISVSSLQLLTGAEDCIPELSEAIRLALPSASYAIRSSGLHEDGGSSSLAGCFHSEVEVAAGDLERGLSSFLNHPRNTLALAEGQFSAFVQAFVSADYSGICFTRDPRGNREMVIEYAQGPCSALVSGEITPERFRRFHGSQNSSHQGKDFRDLCRYAEQIETHFAFPQDIEWCERGGEVFILQSRAITSIRPARALGLQAIDVALKGVDALVLERTGVSEIAPHPCQLTFSLLEFLYRKSGPVDSVYRRWGIAYRPEKILQMFSGDLFINRLAERRTLFPASVFDPAGVPKLSLKSPGAYLQSIWNAWKFQKVRIPPADRIREKLCSMIREAEAALPESEQQLDSAMQRFSILYETVFEINLYAEISLKRLSAAMKLLAPEILPHLPSVLSGDSESEPQPPKAGVIQGNSLDFLDESEFHPLISQGARTKENYFEKLPAWKQNYLKPLVQQAASFSRMREHGRWLALLGREALRKAVLRSGGTNFFTLDEILTGQVSESEGRKREELYRTAARLDLPDLISTFLSSSESVGMLGVSPGIVEGTLLSEEDLVSRAELPPDAEKPILYAPLLSPHLLQYFPLISGIVAEKGGLLSHLSILAREEGLPVIVNASLGSQGLALGRRFRVDGAGGTIEELLAARPEEF